jgi:hypothetical protein
MPWRPTGLGNLDEPPWYTAIMSGIITGNNITVAEMYISLEPNLLKSSKNILKKINSQFLQHYSFFLLQKLLAVHIVM